MITGISIGIIIIGLIIYFRRRKNEIDLSKLNREEIDLLLLVDLTNYIKESFIRINDKSIEPIVLNLKKSPTKGISFNENEYKGKHIYVATFYNKEKEEIVEEFSKVFIAKKIDETIIQAFGDKNMIVLT